MPNPPASASSSHEIATKSPSSAIQPVSSASFQGKSHRQRYLSWLHSRFEPMHAARWIQGAALWSGLRVLGIGLWFGLIYPLLWEWPTERRIIGAGVAMLVLAWLLRSVRRRSRLTQNLPSSANTSLAA